MNFDEKVNFLRSLPQFKVIPISEVRAVAFAAKEKKIPEPQDHTIAILPEFKLTLTTEDIEKIIRAYPDLAPKLV